jgi:ATP-dependent protease ClpP protease subunit
MEISKALEASEIGLNELKAKQIGLEIASMERMSAKSIAEDHTGQFHFISPVHETSVHQLIQRIDSYVRRYPEGEVEILLNSGGGSVLDGFALIDYLERIKRQGTHVRIVGIGLTASMAGIILQAASERVLTRHAWLGMHEISSVIQGSITVAEDTMKFSKALQAQAVALLCERSPCGRGRMSSSTPPKP